MNTKIFKLFATSLLLALMMVGIFSVSGSPQAHAASTSSSEQAAPALGCNPGGAVPVPEQLIAVAIEGTVTHITACGVQLLTAGLAPVALLGPAGAIVSTVSLISIQVAAALSCDGGVYVYTSNLTLPPSAVVIPDC